MAPQIQSAWQYRHFIISSIRAEFKGRIARSRIGAAWFVLHPLAIALIYALVLSEVLGAKLGGIDNPGAYGIYLLAGITAWSIFAEITNRCINVFVEYASAIKKISFPKVALPLIVLGSALVTQLLLFGAVALIAALYGFYPNTAWLLLPVVLAVTCILAFGLGMFLGVLNVFSRDVTHVMTVVMNMWFWLTPIVYASEMLPESMQTVIALNPVTPIVAAYQQAVVYADTPDWLSLMYPFLLGLGFCGVATLVLRRASSDLVDAL